MRSLLFIVASLNVLFSSTPAGLPIKVSKEVHSHSVVLPQPQDDPAKIQILGGDRESNATKPVLLAEGGAAAGSSTTNGVFPTDVNGFPETINQFTQQQTDKGGTESTFILKEGNTPKFVLKKVAENGAKIDQFKEEVLADAIYQAIGKAEPSFGILVPKFQIRLDQGKLSRITEYLPGDDLGIANTDALRLQSVNIARGFVVDAFMANWDLVVSGGKNLRFSGGEIYRMDNGGSLRYRATGELKATTGYDFSTAVNDLYTLRGQKSPLNQNLPASTDGKNFYGNLTQADILKQIEKLVALQEVILKTADQYNDWLNIKDYAKLKSNLINRLESLKAYYYDQVQPVTQYELAHPFAVAIANKSFVSILMVATGTDGRKKVLLAKSVRNDWWSNFGVEADNTDKTLLNAAVSEVDEESMRIYQASPDDLVDAPSHDLIKGGNTTDALHRMYLMNVDYKEPAIFMEELNKPIGGSNGKYRDFDWVDVEVLLALVHSNLDTENDEHNEKQYALRVDNKEIYIHHPLMDMLRQAPVVAWLEALAANSQVPKVHTQGSIGCPRPTNVTDGAAASSSTALVSTLVPAATITYPNPPFFDPRAEDEENIHKLFSNLNAEPTCVHEDVLTSQKLPKQTATDAYLKWSLEQQARQSYVTNNDLQNVYLFLQHVSTTPNSKSYFQEFSPTAAVTNYRKVILSAMQKEREMPDWFVFYHTLQDKMAFIYDIITAIKCYLQLKSPSNDSEFSIYYLRAFDASFKGLRNVEAFVADQVKKQNKDFSKLDNYEGDFNEKGISTNINLFGNPNTDTSSTFDLLHEDSSVRAPVYENLLRNILFQFGLTNTKKYFDLFERYFGTDSQNQLLQIFINPAVVDDIVYLSGTMGKGLYQNFAEQKADLNPNKFLTKLRENPEEANHILEPLRSDLNSIQARIFLRPSIMLDPHKVQIRRHFKKIPKSGYLKALRDMVKNDLTQWLQQHNPLSPALLNSSSSSSSSSLASSASSKEYPANLQRLYRRIQLNAQKVYETITAETQYVDLLRNDNVNGIEQILELNPNFDLFKSIASTAYQSGQGKSQIYPAELLGKAPKISAMILSKYINQVKSHIEDAKNSNDYEKMNAYLIWCQYLVTISDQLYKQAEELAAECIKSKITRENAFALFKALIAKNQFNEAQKSATEGINSPDSSVRDTACKLLEMLVEKGQFEAAKKAVVECIKSKDKLISAKALILSKALIEIGQFDTKDEIYKAVVQTATKEINSPYPPVAAYNLFKVLIEKGQFEEVKEVATKAIEMAYPDTAFKLFDVFIEKGQFDLVAEVLAIGVEHGFNYEVRKKACILLADLVTEKDQFITKTQFDLAAKAAVEVISNQDHGVIESAFKLLEALVVKGMSFDLAAKAAVKVITEEISNRDYPVIESAFKLLEALVAKDQGFKEAIEAAKAGIASGIAGISGLKLFVQLFTKDQGFKEAIDVAKAGIASTNNAVKGLSIILFTKLVEKDQGIAEARKAVEESVPDNNKIVGDYAQRLKGMLNRPNVAQSSEVHK
ncbi:MAG: hypothetical protein NT128_03905 [Proteobacteria bacterium]|nr:hypothetical protein [Pseudomonadota bacterium]